jgi:hypothetical protein
MELFAQRAREVEPDLVVDAAETAAVAAICARLDGLPLALELAAARCNLFSPQALLARLDQRLTLLHDGVRERPARQQTLRATLAWSYDLLRPAEQALLRRLAVFVGGFDMEAAQAVCASARDSGAALPRGLAALVASSLLRTGESGRYEMLETVHEYAAERLAASSRSQLVHERHAQHFLQLAEAADVEMAGPRVTAWVARLSDEHANLRAALTWLREHHQVDTALQLAGALWRFWQVHGYVSDGRRWLELVLDASADTPSLARARALVGAGALAWRQQDPAQAQLRLEEAVRVCRAVGDRTGLATALKHLGLVALYAPTPDLEGAEQLLRESLALRRGLDDRDGVASCLNDLGWLSLIREDYPAANEFLKESLAICRALNNRYGLNFVLNTLSLLCIAEGAYERVPALLNESLQLARELRSKESVSCALNFLACLAAVRDEPGLAARLLGAAEASRAEINLSLSPTETDVFERHIALARAQATPEAWQHALQTGRTEAVDELIESCRPLWEVSAPPHM